MQGLQFSIAAVAAVVGFILALALETIPKLKTLWTSAQYKVLILFCAFEVVAFGWWALGCWGGIGFPATGLTCGLKGLGPAMLIGAFGFAGTQTGYAVAARYTENAQDR